MRVLAIDPGFDKVGYSVFEKRGAGNFTFVTSGLIKTNPKEALILRIKSIIEALADIIKKEETTCMIMEQLFFFKNAKTVIAVAQAQGAIMSLAAEYNLAFHFLTPLQIKQIVTGDGRAEKAAVHKLTQLQLGTNVTIKEDDESDAIACGLAWCLYNETLAAKGN